MVVLAENAHQPFHPNKRQAIVQGSLHNTSCQEQSLRNIPIRLSQTLRAPPRIQEEALALFYVFNLNLLVFASINVCEHTCWSQQLQCIAQADLFTERTDLVLGGTGDVELLGTDSGADDGLDLCRTVRVGGDDEEAREQVRGNAVCGRG